MCRQIGQSALSPVPSTSFRSFKGTSSDETTSPLSAVTPSCDDKPCGVVGGFPDLHTESTKLITYNTKKKNKHVLHEDFLPK